MPVIELNSQNENMTEKIPQIKGSIATSAVVLVWATWCPHCVSMKGEWNKFKTSVDPAINVVEIESQNLERIKHQDKQLFKKLYPDEHRVFYPLIKSFSKSKGEIYEDQRKSAVMKQHFENRLNSGNNANKTEKTAAKTAPKKQEKPKKNSPNAKKKKGGDGTATSIEMFKKELDHYIKNLMKQI